MIWDNPETYGRYKEDLKQLGYPVYPVIGNHDHTEIYNDNHQSEQAYRLYFGPTYYAFNMGCDYYIVLDNIFYTGLRQYNEMLTAGQLEWVKQYTRYIPKGAHVFVAMHAPAKMYTSDHYQMYASTWWHPSAVLGGCGTAVTAWTVRRWVTKCSSLLHAD